MRGFTLIEMLVVISITSILTVALVRFVGSAYPLSREIWLQQHAVETARIQLKRISHIMRELRPSDTGAYALVEMESQRMIFYVDIDDDDNTERVRYELNGANLERGVIEPTGTPAVYDENSEQVSVVARSIRNGGDPIFIYYNGNYPEDTTQLNPVDITEVKYVQFDLVIDVDESVEPEAFNVLSQVQLRNLKTNLGELNE